MGMGGEVLIRINRSERSSECGDMGGEKEEELEGESEREMRSEK